MASLTSTVTMSEDQAIAATSTRADTAIKRAAKEIRKLGLGSEIHDEWEKLIQSDLSDPAFFAELVQLGRIVEILTGKFVLEILDRLDERRRDLQGNLEEVGKAIKEGKVAFVDCLCAPGLLKEYIKFVDKNGESERWRTDIAFLATLSNNFNRYLLGRFDLDEIAFMG